ncbi:MAG TPA: hypothetical protein VF278_21420 [Pirellulales bacterium]
MPIHEFSSRKKFDLSNATLFIATAKLEIQIFASRGGGRDAPAAQQLLPRLPGVEADFVPKMPPACPEEYRAGCLRNDRRDAYRFLDRLPAEGGQAVEESAGFYGPADVENQRESPPGKRVASYREAKASGERHEKTETSTFYEGRATPMVIHGGQCPPYDPLAIDASEKTAKPT